jgi:hypothetical protein
MINIQQDKIKTDQQINEETPVANEMICNINGKFVNKEPIMQSSKYAF